MPVPATIDDLSTTAGDNSPSGSETPKDGDNYIRAFGAFIATLRDKLNGTANTGTVKAATFTGTHTFSSGNLIAGTYTPTLTVVAGAGGTTAYVCSYARMGASVSVSGSFAATGTSAGTSVRVRISLPISSAFVAGTELGGAARDITNANGETLGIIADATNDAAETFGSAVNSGAKTYSFTFGYQVI